MISLLKRSKEDISEWTAEPRSALLSPGLLFLQCPRLCHTFGRQLPPGTPAGGPWPLRSRMTTAGSTGGGSYFGGLLTYWHLLGVFLSCLFCVPVRPLAAQHPLRHPACRLPEPALWERSTPRRSPVSDSLHDAEDTQVTQLMAELGCVQVLGPPCKHLVLLFP